MSVTHFDKVNVQLGVIVGGTAGNHTLTGVAVGDRILSVWTQTFATTGALSATSNLTAEFTDPIAAANVIANASGSNTTDKPLFVLWMDANLT